MKEGNVICKFLVELAAVRILAVETGDFAKSSRTDFQIPTTSSLSEELCFREAAGDVEQEVARAPARDLKTTN